VFFVEFGATREALLDIRFVEQLGLNYRSSCQAANPVKSPRKRKTRRREEAMPQQWLNYHHLYYFRVIALEGSIAKAAKRLRLGQPTLSTQLKQFEEAIGHELFERRQKRLHLTESGRAALEYANEIFRLGDEMLEVLDDRKLVDRVEIQIGAIDTVPKNLTLRLVEKAQATRSCTVHIAEGRGDEHRLDLVISNAPPGTGDSGLFARSIAKMPVVVCGARPYVHLRKGFPGSLEGAPFVLPTQHSRLRQDIDHYLKLRGIRPNVAVEVQDTALQKLLATHAIGVTVIAEPAAAELMESKELFALGRLDDIYEELWLIAAERRLENPVAAQLMKSFSI
jgi:LysR family transcriptional activator of nhaA